MESKIFDAITYIRNVSKKKPSRKGIFNYICKNDCSTVDYKSCEKYFNNLLDNNNIEMSGKDNEESVFILSDVPEQHFDNTPAISSHLNESVQLEGVSNGDEDLQSLENFIDTMAKAQSKGSINKDVNSTSVALYERLITTLESEVNFLREQFIRKELSYKNEIKFLREELFFKNTFIQSFYDIQLNQNFEKSSALKSLDDNKDQLSEVVIIDDSSPKSNVTMTYSTQTVNNDSHNDEYYENTTNITTSLSTQTVANDLFIDENNECGTTTINKNSKGKVTSNVRITLFYGHFLVRTFLTII